MTVFIPVDITHHDIDGGTPRSQCNCPVARAVYRALPGELRVVVQPSRVADGRLELAYGTGYRLPAKLNEFALAWDRGETCSPCCVLMAFGFVSEAETEAFCSRNNIHERYREVAA